MGSVLINVPDFSDAELVYNEIETRQILKFFWPVSSTAIDGLTIDNDARRLAQIALVAAIEGTYALGYVNDLSNVITQRNINLRTLVKKLARKFVRRWWKHTQQQDLEHVRIYEAVRAPVAVNLRPRFEMLLAGIALRSGVSPFFAQKSSYTVWA